MADRQRRALLQCGFGTGVAALLPACSSMRPERLIAPAVTGTGFQVDSIAALRELSPSTAQVVDVAGYHFPDDGGGGRFFWVADHPGADDCGTVVAPDRTEPASGRWQREVIDELEFAWFGPAADGRSDDSGPLQRAIDCATRTGRPLRLGPGDYHIASDITARVGAEQRLELRGEGALIRRRSRSGTLYFEADEIATLAIVETILPGGDGITVDDASSVRVGDLVEVTTGVQLGESRNSSWTASEYGQVVAIRGNRLVLDGPTLHRVHPNRRLAYRMNGQTDTLHYRLFWGTDIEDVRVSLDGTSLSAGSDYEISGQPYNGFDIRFFSPPSDGSIVELSTAHPIGARVFRGGELSVSSLRFESDFSESGPVAFIDGRGLTPANSRFSRLQLVETNAPMDENGYRRGVEGDLFRIRQVNSLIEGVQVSGGRYAIMVVHGRNVTIRNIVAEGCWHAVATFDANTISIQNVVATRCYAAVDSHYAQIQRVDGVEGIDCWDGMNHRANGGSVRNVVMMDNRSPGINGMNFGVGQGMPLHDRMLVDPRDDPQTYFDNSVQDLLIENSRFAAPHDADGFGLYGAYLRRVILRNVETDGPLAIDGDGPPPVRELTMEHFNSRQLRLRGVTGAISAKRISTGQLDLHGCQAALIRFDNSVFDGAIGQADTLIIDGETSGALECRFVNCTFRNAASLIAENGTSRHFKFVDCNFEVDDAGPFG